MTVYIVRPGARNIVKIGHTGNIHKRIKEMQISSPERILLIATIEGGEREERQIHTRLRSERIRGEWFKLSKPVREFLQRLKLADYHLEYGLLTDSELAQRLEILATSGEKTINGFMINDGCRNHLLHLAEIYSLATGRSLQTISRVAYGRHGFLEQYRKGECSLTLHKYDKMLDWFKDNWPKGVHRPRFPTINWPNPPGPKRGESETKLAG
jgi:hypothetical protein